MKKKTGLKTRIDIIMFDLGLRKDYSHINSSNNGSPRSASGISGVLSRSFRIATYTLLNLHNIVKNVYYLSLQAAMAASNSLRFRKNDYAREDLRAHFEKYLDSEYFYPSNVLLKSLEGYLFSKARIESPSLEIGIEDGRISRLHFAGQSFDYGAEFVYQYLKKNKDDGIHKGLISFDASKEFPFKDNQFKTVAAVHVFDHFGGIDKTLKEISRVLEDGGTLYFSAHSDGLFDSYISYNAVKYIEKAIRLVAPKFNLFSRTYTSFVTYKRSVHNMFSREDWVRLIEGSGLRIVEADYFLKGKHKYVWSHFNGIECSNGTCVTNALLRYNLLPGFFKNFMKKAAYSIFYDDFCREVSCYESPGPGSISASDHGVNVFIVAKKGRGNG